MRNVGPQLHQQCSEVPFHVMKTYGGMKTQIHLVLTSAQKEEYSVSRISISTLTRKKSSSLGGTQSCSQWVQVTKVSFPAENQILPICPTCNLTTTPTCKVSLSMHTLQHKQLPVPEISCTFQSFGMLHHVLERNQTFNMHLMHPSSTLKMEAPGFSATMVPIYQLTHTQCHTPEDWNFDNLWYKNLKSQILHTGS